MQSNSVIDDCTFITSRPRSCGNTYNNPMTDLPSVTYLTERNVISAPPVGLRLKKPPDIILIIHIHPYVFSKDTTS